MKTIPKIFSNIHCKSLLIVLLSINLSAFSQEILINEVMMKNENYLMIDGGFYDWIEIYNPTNSPIQLNAYSLSDKADELNLWGFPDSLLPPQSFITIIASGLDHSINYLHTNFSLKNNTETIYLSKNNLLIDQLSPIKLHPI